jgi:hypothetical protein
LTTTNAAINGQTLCTTPPIAAPLDDATIEKPTSVVIS